MHAFDRFIWRIKAASYCSYVKQNSLLTFLKTALTAGSNTAAGCAAADSSLLIAICRLPVLGGEPAAAIDEQRFASQ